MSLERIRDYGICPGRLPIGEKNSITDVPGVKVGHWTLINESHQTGVTVILPREDIYLHKCSAAVHVINGYGKSAGLVQIEELGQLETPIALTNTLGVGLVSDALVQYTIDELAKKDRELRSLNPVVGECNDAGLNRIAERVVGYPQLMEAIQNASDTFAQGSVGAGAGMTCHDLKGGIGSASRVMQIGRMRYTLGVLALCNHGNLADLMVCGRPVGQEILEEERKRRKEASRESSKETDVGSCIIVVGTDLPVSDRQLKRIIRRSAAGLARCGSYWGHGSGDIAIGFTTAHDIAEDEKRVIVEQQVLTEKMVERAFQAAAEATEESVLNALAAARPVSRPDGTVRHALCEYLKPIHKPGL